MQRFILEQNIDAYQRLLSKLGTDAPTRATIEYLLATAQRELAILCAELSGAYAGLLPRIQTRVTLASSGQDIARFQADFDKSEKPYLLLDPGPGLHIIDANDAYATATLIKRGTIVGEKLFDAFPDNPNDPLADGAQNLYASLRIAQERGEVHKMSVQRYDVRDAAGSFVERHWQPSNMPIFDENGRLLYLLHHVEDVTPVAVTLRKARG